MNPTIEKATPDDRPAIDRLLERNALPTIGLADHLDTTLVARDEGGVVGSAALEMYRDGALLRSVAVDASVRGSGLGLRLTDAALAMARERGAPAVYLLTTTAERFFPRFGFSRVPREHVPATIRESVEFTSACPASAVVMMRPL
jgi:amino-acid N-acetyltransferase